ncbi:transposase domain-containing protein [Mitsuokella sp. WILCCON 0060]|uniref:transposase domain-containing protein n=1 Tax=Mitsuokella sp. WILCCON 0060 TaxID=3345341 RepID=UPI003F1D00B1
MLETAKVNEINPYKYFKYLFEQLPNIDFLRHPEKLDDFLPWSDNIQQNCK